MSVWLGTQCFVRGKWALWAGSLHAVFPKHFSYPYDYTNKTRKANGLCAQPTLPKRRIVSANWWLSPFWSATQALCCDNGTYFKLYQLLQLIRWKKTEVVRGSEIMHTFRAYRVVAVASKIRQADTLTFNWLYRNRECSLWYCIYDSPRSNQPRVSSKYV